MASSAYQIISNAVNEIVKTQPKSVLDIGIGFGKWGFLCREYIDCWRDRIYPDKWQVEIVGIEIWERFANLEWNKIIYDKIIVGDALYEIDKLPNFDLIIASDVLEHLEKNDGLLLLRKILSRINSKAIINVPVGERWLNNVILDSNPYERHRAVWEPADLVRVANEFGYDYRFYTWDGVRGEGVLGIYEKN